MKAVRFKENPIIVAAMPGLTRELPISINGPSVIKVPDWVENKLGKYYLYFAHHRGAYIRLAYADNLSGPWRVYEKGTLHLSQTCCEDHIASPDVHIDNDHKEFRMYFHGPCPSSEKAKSLFDESQVTFLAYSKDGINFSADREVLGLFYFRVFKYKDYFYAIAKNKNKGGIIYRSKDGKREFEAGPEIIPRMRHCAVKLDNNTLLIFFTRLLDCPESVLLSYLDLSKDWTAWQVKEAKILLKPELDFEGANLPLAPSMPGMPHAPVNQLRDPCIFEEDGRTFLFYSAAGESCIAIAELIDDIA